MKDFLESWDSVLTKGKKKKLRKCCRSNLYVSRCKHTTVIFNNFAPNHFSLKNLLASTNTHLSVSMDRNNFSQLHNEGESEYHYCCTGKGTSLPSWPVKTSATWKGCERNLWIFLARATVSLSSSDNSSIPRIAMISWRDLWSYKKQTNKINNQMWCTVNKGGKFLKYSLTG